MKTVRQLAAAALVAAGGLQAFAQPQAASLDFLTRPLLIECEPDGSESCFRMKFDFLDAAGNPVNVQLPPNTQLKSQVEVQVEGQAVKPFYAAATEGDSNRARKPQMAILLFDVS